MFVFFPLNAVYAGPPTISSKAGFLMDAVNGQVLYQKNADIKLDPASTTKILTGIIALEKAHLDEMVTVTGNVMVEGSAIGLQEGERIKMEDLLYALLLTSANDSAVAIAEHVGGSVPGFVRMMNEKAAELGAMNTHFVNPHGLTESNHKTTARDLAIIARYAMKNKKFREIVNTRNKEISRGISPARDPQTWTYNHNELLWKYNGAIGIKTGYTSVAEYCLVGSARNGARELISVILQSDDSNSRYTDNMALLDYGFGEFEPKTLIEAGEIVNRFEVPHGTAGVLAETQGSFVYNLPVDQGRADSQPAVSYKLKSLVDLEAPVQKGDIIGQLLLYYGSEEIGQVDLMAIDDVPRKFTHHWWFWPSVATAILVVLRFWLGVRRRRKKFMFS